MTPQVRWGIVGTGDISRYLARDFSLAENATVVAVSSRSSESATAFGAEFGIQKAYDDLDLLLRDDGVDAVYIATPHTTHRDIALRTLAAGKHILVEKPIGVNRAEVLEIQQAAEAAGLFAMEAMWMSFNPLFNKLQADLKDGSIGHVHSLRASFGFAPRGDRPVTASAILDRGIYPLTLAHALFGEPDRVTAAGHVADNGLDLDVHATLEYSDGRYAQVSASQTGYIDPSASINGTSGWIEIPATFWSSAAYTTRSGSIVETLRNPRTTAVDREGFGYVPMIRQVSEAILDGRTSHRSHTFADSAAVFSVMDEIRNQLGGGPV